LFAKFNILIPELCLEARDISTTRPESAFGAIPFDAGQRNKAHTEFHYDDFGNWVEQEVKVEMAWRHHSMESLVTRKTEYDP